MAKLTRTINGNFDGILQRITEGVMNNSATASLEDVWDVRTDAARCSVRVFERYSYLGRNRVSMSVTLFQEGSGPLRLCAITSGGSQAVVFKMNTVGEETFLSTLKEILEE